MIWQGHQPVLVIKRGNYKLLYIIYLEILSLSIIDNYIRINLNIFYLVFLENGCPKAEKYPMCAESTLLTFLNEIHKFYIDLSSLSLFYISHLLDKSFFFFYEMKQQKKYVKTWLITSPWRTVDFFFFVSNEYWFQLWHRIIWIGKFLKSTNWQS